MESSQQILLDVVTPERRVVRETTISVTLPGKSGYLGVLPGHAPLITELAPGDLAFVHDAVTEHLSVSGGYAEVLGDRVTVLAPASERPEEIDVDRAERARRRAEERLKQVTRADIDFERARIALARSMTRLQIAGYRSHRPKSS